MIRFDLALFQALNAEYETKPVVRNARDYAPQVIADRGAKVSRTLGERFQLNGKRVLEIGCGRGEVATALADGYGCQVTAIDLRRHEQWQAAPNVTFRRLDLAAPGGEDLGTFDFIYSNSVWEHLKHPTTMLARAHAALAPGGDFYLVANLYRGPVASHRYREVFFPWPHLLFTDDVFEQFYASIGRKPARPSWVNRLSVSDYLIQFQTLGFELRDLKYTLRPIDEPFYQRFVDVLGRYPRFDLERDFIKVHLRKS